MCHVVLTQTSASPRRSNNREVSKAGNTNIHWSSFSRMCQFRLVELFGRHIIHSIMRPLVVVFLRPLLRLSSLDIYQKIYRDSEAIRSLTSGTEQHPDAIRFPYTQYGESGNTSTTLVLCIHASDTQLDKMMVDLPCHLLTCKRIHE